MNNLVYVFIIRLCVRLYVLTLCSTYVSTESILCFDFEFDDRTFSNMDFRSTSDMRKNVPKTTLHTVKLKLWSDFWEVDKEIVKNLSFLVNFFRLRFFLQVFAKSNKNKRIGNIRFVVYFFKRHHSAKKNVYITI